jgi:hypothetical protein
MTRPSSRDSLVHVEAERRLVESPLSRGEVIRRLGRAPAQFYRPLDPTNYRMSIDGVLGLLQVLEREVSRPQDRAIERVEEPRRRPADCVPPFKRSAGAGFQDSAPMGV